MQEEFTPWWVLSPTTPGSGASFYAPLLCIFLCTFCLDAKSNKKIKASLQAVATMRCYAVVGVITHHSWKLHGSFLRPNGLRLYVFHLLFALMQKVTKRSSQRRRQLPQCAVEVLGEACFGVCYRRWHRSAFRLQALFPGHFWGR